MKRRRFLYAGAAAALAVGPSRGEPDPVGSFAGILQGKHLPEEPVILESLDLFVRGGNWFARARSTDGLEGWSVGHPSLTALCHPVFTRVIAPFMKGKDMRRLEDLVDEVFLTGSHYKAQGQLFWVPVATAEFAILDLLGKAAQKPAAELLGGAKRQMFELYVANNHRQLGAEDSLRRIVESVEKIDARAVKFKIGGRMKVVDQVEGRTRKLIPMVAEALGQRCTIYADANSSYVSTKKAIEVGRLLEKHGVAFYEEPCPFDYLEETRAVADALDIPIAWGEQESSQWRFHHMIETGGVQIPQPDLFYYGGLIRSLRVARMAERKGLNCTPHISGGGLGFLYTGIYAACCPNPGPHQEYKGLTRSFPWESTGMPIVVREGKMTAPTGPGLGVEIDPEFLAKARPVGKT